MSVVALCDVLISPPLPQFMLFLERLPNFFMVLLVCHQPSVTDRCSNRSPDLHFRFCGTYHDISLLTWWTWEGQMRLKLSLHKPHLYKNFRTISDSVLVWKSAAKRGSTLRRSVSQIFDECVRTPNTWFCVFKNVWKPSAQEPGLTCVSLDLCGIFCYLYFPGRRTQKKPDWSQYRGCSLLVLEDWIPGSFSLFWFATSCVWHLRWLFISRKTFKLSDSGQWIVSFSSVLLRRWTRRGSISAAVLKSNYTQYFVFSLFACQCNSRLLYLHSTVVLTVFGLDAFCPRLWP